MAADRGANRFPSPSRIAILAALLLFVRFASTTSLLGADLTQPTLITVGAVLTVYEVVLPFVLIPVFFLFLLRREPPVPFRASLALLALLGAALVTWLLAVLGVGVPATALTFLALGTASVAAGSWAALPFTPERREAMRPWTPWLHRALLVAVPVAFAMRVAALQGLDPVTGSGAGLRANWFFVHLPTLLLEFLVVAFFVNVLFDRTPAELRRRWYAFLPFLLIPIILDAVSDRPLTGYILSAFVTWGANLALFTPALASIGLITAVVVAFLAADLLLGVRPNRPASLLLFFGCGSVLFAGFYPSMASVAGIDVGLLSIAAAIRTWPRGSVTTATPPAPAAPSDTQS